MIELKASNIFPDFEYQKKFLMALMDAYPLDKFISSLSINECKNIVHLDNCGHIIIYRKDHFIRQYELLVNRERENLSVYATITESGIRIVAGKTIEDTIV